MKKEELIPDKQCIATMRQAESAGEEAMRLRYNGTRCKEPLIQELRETLKTVIKAQ